jgi:hypothetical protein
MLTLILMVNSNDAPMRGTLILDLGLILLLNAASFLIRFRKYRRPPPPTP